MAGADFAYLVGEPPRGIGEERTEVAWKDSSVVEIPRFRNSVTPGCAGPGSRERDTSQPSRVEPTFPVFQTRRLASLSTSLFLSRWSFTRALRDGSFSILYSRSSIIAASLARRFRRLV